MVCKAEAVWPAAEYARSASAEDVMHGLDGCAAFALQLPAEQDINGRRPLLPVAGAFSSAPSTDRALTVRTHRRRLELQRSSGRPVKDACQKVQGSLTLGRSE